MTATILGRGRVVNPWAVAVGEQPWRAQNNGATWQAVPGVAPFALPAAPVFGLAVHPDDSNVLDAATEVGVFASDDFGASWSTSNDGPANVVCEEITFAHGNGPRQLVLATLGRGIWTAQVMRPTAVPFGSACVGHTSPPQLAVDPQAKARLGRTMSFDGSSLWPGVPFAWLLLGLSNTVHAGQPLPLALDGLGLIGCSLQTSVELVLTTSVSAGGIAQWDLALPGNPQLLAAGHLVVRAGAVDRTGCEPRRHGGQPAARCDDWLVNGAGGRLRRRQLPRRSRNTERAEWPPKRRCRRRGGRRCGGAFAGRCGSEHANTPITSRNVLLLVTGQGSDADVGAELDRRHLLVDHRADQAQAVRDGEGTARNAQARHNEAKQGKVGIATSVNKLNPP